MPARNFVRALGFVALLAAAPAYAQAPAPALVEAREPQPSEARTTPRPCEAVRCIYPPPSHTLEVLQ